MITKELIAELKDRANGGFGSGADAAQTVQLINAIEVLTQALEFIETGCLVPPEGGDPKHPDDEVAAACEALVEVYGEDKC